MKSEVIMIDNHGNGFSEAVEQTRHFCESCDGMSDKEILQLQLISEEMLSLVRSITGEMRASFWIEGNGTEIEFHMTTQTVMDKEKRGLLIMSATSMRNEAAKGFLGKLRDVFEQAMASEPNRAGEAVPYELRGDVANTLYEREEWDGYERLILRRLADNVKISIRGRTVEMTVCKRLAE